MTSKLKCPFCETELEQGIELWRGGHILGCPKCKRNADDIFWFALNKQKQDLEIATKAMNQVMSMGAKNNICYHLKAKTVKNILGNALKQIEHKE